MSRCWWSWALIFAVPVALLGQVPGAILHTQGGVWVNGYEAQDAAAVFDGDVLQTKPGFSAKLDLEGSSVLVQPESVIKFHGDSLTLDHGSVSVGTSRSFKVLVKCITVVPVTNDWTSYDVTDVNGTVQVAAIKSDVNVNHSGSQGAKQEKAQPEASDSQKASVHQGEQKSYNESDLCGAPLNPTGAGSLLNPKWIAAGAAGVGVLIWILIHGGGGQTPMSASQP
ncbi:MAG TPA: hypothetical protein VKV39_01780 [Candidatus Sulfotelmatobacter sp.]|nr:hypothetical protein [Candidatus Sulfotelmatobacter sp.]